MNSFAASIFLLLVAARPSTDQELAKKLFNDGKELFRAHRYREAAERMRDAYSADPDPSLLYNAARALELAGDEKGARALYQRYVDIDPLGPDRVAVEEKIRALDRSIDAHARVIQEASLPAIERKPIRPKPVVVEAIPTILPKDEMPLVKTELQKHKSNAAPWFVFALGVAGGGAGLAMGMVSRNMHLTAADDPVQLSSSRLEDRAQGFALGANIAYVAGGALAVIGLIWAIASSD